VKVLLISPGCYGGRGGIAESISRKYKEGDKVKITSGAFMGIEGFVVTSNSGKNIEVLLESIGQCIRVKLPKEAFSLIEFQEA